MSHVSHMSRLSGSSGAGAGGASVGGGHGRPGAIGVPKLACPRLVFWDPVSKVDHVVMFVPSTGQLVAQCGLHGDNCHRAKVSYAGRRQGQGTPMGLLGAWSFMAHTCDTRELHMGLRSV